MTPPDPRHQDAGAHTGTCEACGETRTARVTEDTWNGAVAWTCPECETTQEPPAEEAGR